MKQRFPTILAVPFLLLTACGQDTATLPIENSNLPDQVKKGPTEGLRITVVSASGRGLSSGQNAQVMVSPAMSATVKFARNLKHLDLKAVCAGQWLVENQNKVNVAFSWRIDGTSERGSAQIKATSSLALLTIARSGKMRIEVGKYQHDLEQATSAPCRQEMRQ